ncbi:hypothetical protein ACP4OV_012173 [Aristida adscensionis]
MAAAAVTAADRILLPLRGFSQCWDSRGSRDATDLLQKLALDPTGGAGDVPAVKEKAPAKGVAAVGGNPAPGMEQSGTPNMQDYMDASMYYGACPAYGYGAYGGWGEYSTYVSHDGGQTPTAIHAYGEMYYGYTPYGFATLGHDGQMYGSQNYQYPLTHNKQQNSTTKPPCNGKTDKLSPLLQGDVSTNGVDGLKGLKSSDLSLKADRNMPGSNGSYAGSNGRSGSYQNQTKWSSYPYYSSQMLADKSQKPASNHTSTAYNAKSKGQSRNQNTKSYPHLMVPYTPTSGTGTPSIYSTNGIYGEDTIHKSIKYNLWASTPNGNTKLDAAYQEAKEKSNESSVFLLFSEVVGHVDFNKTVEHWQQDRWTGCFPVKCHIVKDVPNSLLRHIILENNENKPVTNCRDTHEVKLEQGLQVLKIFKDHVCKTSILDDFGFHDNHEKIMQERKAKHQHSLKKVTVVKLPNAIDTEKQMLNGELGSQKLAQVEVDVLNNQPSHGKAGGPKEGAEGNGVVPQDLKSPIEKLACANGC